MGCIPVMIFRAFNSLHSKSGPVTSSVSTGTVCLPPRPYPLCPPGPKDPQPPLLPRDPQGLNEPPGDMHTNSSSRITCLTLEKPVHLSGSSCPHLLSEKWTEGPQSFLPSVMSYGSSKWLYVLQVLSKRPHHTSNTPETGWHSHRGLNLSIYQPDFCLIRCTVLTEPVFIIGTVPPSTLDPATPLSHPGTLLRALLPPPRSVPHEQLHGSFY